jgi:hypothetical protein
MRIKTRIESWVRNRRTNKNKGENKMKKWFLLAVLLSSVKVYGMEGGGGVGWIASDRDGVEDTVVGKAEAMFNIGEYFGIGLSGGQTGEFNQTKVPSEITYANANPNAFGAKKHHDHDGDVIIIEGDDVSIVNISLAPPILPKRPVDLTERSFWFAEPFVEVGIPFNTIHLVGDQYIKIKPYFRGFLGASGVRTWGGNQDIGLSEGIGAGIAVNLVGNIAISGEWTRRYINTGKNSYGNNTAMAKVSVGF